MMKSSHRFGRRLVSLLSIGAAIAVSGLITSASHAQPCDFGCEDGKLPTPAKITVSYSSSYTNTGGSCGVDGSGTLETCGRLSAFDVPISGPGTLCAEADFGDPYDYLETIKVTNITANGEWSVQIGEGNTLSESGPSNGLTETISQTCTSFTYTYNFVFAPLNVVETKTLKIKISGGLCEEAPDGVTSLCADIEDGSGDEVCPTDDEDVSPEGETPTETDASIAHLSGHKIERSTDLTVSLPGRDFSLKREYSSDPDLFHSNSLGQYSWRGATGSVVPGHMGVNWTANVFRALVGPTWSEGDLYLTGAPLRTTRTFVYDDDDGNGPVRYLPRSSSSQYIYEATVTVPVLGTQTVNRLREPGGKECDFAAKPSAVPQGPNGLGWEDLTGKPIFERDEYGNTWYYEYAIIVDNTGSARDSVVLASIYLNWEDANTWAARVDFLWNGLQNHPNIDDDTSGSDNPSLNPYKAVTPLDVNSEPNHHFGRMAEVRVIRPDGMSEVETQSVRYLYYEDIKGRFSPNGSGKTLEQSRFDGSDGDLCQVIKSTLVDEDEGEPADGYYQQVWQYRYYSDDFYQDPFGSEWPGYNNGFHTVDFSGADHQLLAVFYPEQIEFFADHYAQEAIAQSNTNSNLRTVPFASVVEAADQLLWILFDEYANEDVTFGLGLGPDWEDYLLPNEHWTSLFDVASKMISYYEFDHGHKYRVQTQFVNAGDASGAGCGCGGGSGGGVSAFRLGKRFDYLYKRFNWSSLPDGIQEEDPQIPNPVTNGYSCQVVESRTALSGLMLTHKPYRVRSHDYYWPTNYAVGALSGSESSGVALKVASTLSEANPDWNFSLGGAINSNSNPIKPMNNPRHWVTLYEYSDDTVSSGGDSTFNSYHKVTRQITPSAIDSSVHKYVPAINTGNNTESVVLPGVHADKGLVLDMTYNKSWRSSTGLRKGKTGSVVTPTEKFFDASRPDQVSKIVRSPGIGNIVDTALDTPVETTEFTYGYHNNGVSGTDPNGLIMAWKMIEVTAESMAQNGPDSATKYTSFQMFDTNGQLRWSQDPDGSLTYYGYDETTGAINKVVQDARHDGSYVSTDAMLPGSFSGLGSEWTASSRLVYEELQTEYGIDKLGRTISTTDASGNTRYTRYEVKITDNVEPDGTLNERGVPYFASVSLPYQLADDSFDRPVSVSWSSAGSNSIRSSLYSLDKTATYTPETGVFTTIEEVARSDTELMMSGLPMRQRQWHEVGNISGGSGFKPYVNDGSYVTLYEYDTLGRLFTVIDPEDGITRTESFDIRDRALGTEVGVRDWSEDPIDDETTIVAEMFYDSDQGTTQGVGNGNMTYSVTHVDDVTANDRVTKRWYDYRDRLRGVLNPEAPHMVMEYDELNRVVESANLTSSTGFTDGTDPDSSLPSAGAGSSSRSTYSQTLYNNRGMVYRSRTAIDPTLSSGTTYLESNHWYDEDGNLLASWSPNNGGTKVEYDGLDRQTTVYQTDRAGEGVPGAASNHANASSVTNDHVISQTEYVYIPDNEPGAGGVELVAQRMRHHDAKESGTGEVTGALTGSNSVATYSAYVYDDASRVTDTLQYGTNSSSGFVSSTSAPTAPFDTDRTTSDALISSVDFDVWGRVRKSTDPEGKFTVTKFDDLSRSVAVIESSMGVAESNINWSVSNDNWAVTWPGSAPADQDRVTSFVYDGLSNVVLRTAHLNDGSVQETAYDYGTTAGSTSNVLDSLIGSSSLLHKVHYPNEANGAADTSAAYTVTYAYNRLGELRGMSDQNDTVHEMTRDKLGRVTSDAVDSYAALSTIDSTIDAITATFDDHGRISSVDSLNVLSAVVNSVDFEYTPLHQIEAVVQDVDGAGSVAAERIEYDYTDAAPSTTGGNYSRITGVRYPSQAEVGTADTLDTLNFHYTGETDFDEINDRISRVSGYEAPSWGHTGVDDLVHYAYLGQSTPVNVHYTDIDMGLDYTKGHDGAAASGEYPGFDQYGRVVWHAWVHDNFTTGTGSYPNATPLMARRYAYDKMSNRINDWDGRPGTTLDDRDWEYEYDNLDRLKTANRGLRDDFAAPTTLTTIADNSRQWNLDMLGNWNNVSTDINGDQLFDTGTVETENRAFNSANELTSREGPVGSGNTFSPTYDDAGNYHSNGTPPGSEKLIYTHDAWNRLVKIEREVGGVKSSVLENTFNGLNWRITRKVDLAKGGYEGLDEERRYYYSAGWQMIEEHVDSDLDGLFDEATDYKSQQVWGVRYIDDAVAKRIDRNNDGVWTDTSSEFFYLTDAMFSVRALMLNTSSGGFVHERIDYTPYGVAMHRYAADLTNDGLVDFFDVSKFLSDVTVTTPGSPGYNPDVDLDGNGLMEFFDSSAFLTSIGNFGGTGSDVPDGWISNPGFANDSDNSIGYDGYAFDFAGATDGGTSGTYCVRHRVYDPGFGGWLERDPLGYIDGSSRYVYGSSAPVILVDPLGLCGSAAITPAGALICVRTILFAAGYRSPAAMARELIRMGWAPAAVGAVGGVGAAALVEAMEKYLEASKASDMSMVIGMTLGEIIGEATDRVADSISKATDHYKSMFKELTCNAAKGIVDSVCKGDRRPKAERSCKGILDNLNNGSKLKPETCHLARLRAGEASACAAARAAFVAVCPDRAGINMGNYASQIVLETTRAGECMEVYLRCLAQQCAD